MRLYKGDKVEDSVYKISPTTEEVSRGPGPDLSYLCAMSSSAYGCQMEDKIIRPREARNSGSKSIFWQACFVSVVFVKGRIDKGKIKAGNLKPRYYTTRGQCLHTSNLES